VHVATVATAGAGGGVVGGGVAGGGVGGGGRGSGGGRGGRGATPASEGFFDAGPLLADLVSGPEHARSNRSKRRVLVAASIAAVIALGSGAVAVALTRGDDNGKPRAATVTLPSTTAAPVTTAPTEPPTTEAAPPTTVTTTPSTTQPTVAPPATTPTTAAALRPSVRVTGPLTIEDNVRYVWHSTSTNATSGRWSLSGGPAINLSGTGWSPGTDFGMSAGCRAVGSTYHLTLSVQGPGGSNSATISYNVVDTNGTCR
jgi:hypothetical protein